VEGVVLLARTVAFAPERTATVFISRVRKITESARFAFSKTAFWPRGVEGISQVLLKGYIPSVTVSVHSGARAQEAGMSSEQISQEGAIDTD
jgi:hypothetical protein